MTRRAAVLWVLWLALWLLAVLAQQGHWTFPDDGPVKPF